jgi:GTP-binding protein EngB required for normal cell division
MDSGSQRPVESLNEFQANRLRITCQYIDKLLGDVEGVLNMTAAKAAFPRYSYDIPPAQRRTIEDYIGRVRAQLLRVLDGQGISRHKPSIPASRAVHVTLGAIDIAVEELKPQYMQGYGELPESVATELNGIAGELHGLVLRVDRYLCNGVGEDLKARLARLARDSNDLQLLRMIEETFRERGLVEFRSPIAAILDRAEDKSFEIAVFGRVSSGKSSLLNEILETDILPVGVTPITAVPTRIAHGVEPSLTVWFADAPSRNLGVNQLAEFATEQQNKGNVKHVTRIVVTLPSSRLRGGVAFVDTPGLGSLATSGAAETLAYLPKCDLGVVLIDAGSTLTADDLQTILTLQEAAIPVNVLISKADLLIPADRLRIVDYVKQQIASESNLDVPVHPISVVSSCREMLDEWFQNQIVPLYDQSQELRAASLRRKIGALHESVTAALQARVRRGEQISAKSEDQVRAAEALLRRTTGQIEEMRSLCERAIDGAAASVQGAIDEVSVELVNSWSKSSRSATEPVQLVRESITQFVQLQMGKLRTELSTFAAQLRHDLRQCATDLGLPDSPGEDEFQSVIRGMPAYEPAPFSIVISRPVFAGLLGCRFAARHVARQISRQLGDSFLASLDAHWKLVREWSGSVMGQLKQRFETYAENYRAQAEQALGGGEISSDEQSRFKESLAQLSQGDAGNESVRNGEGGSILGAREPSPKTM